MDESEVYVSGDKDHLLLDNFKFWGMALVLNSMVLISIYVKASYGWSLNLALMRFLPPLVLVDGYLIYLYFSTKNYHQLKSIIFHNSSIELIVLREGLKSNRNRTCRLPLSDCLIKFYKNGIDFVFDDGQSYMLARNSFENFDEIVSKIKSRNIPTAEIEE